jgi:hypothetical protein
MLYCDAHKEKGAITTNDNEPNAVHGTPIKSCRVDSER